MVMYVIEVALAVARTIPLLEKKSMKVDKRKQPAGARTLKLTQYDIETYRPFKF